MSGTRTFKVLLSYQKLPFDNVLNSKWKLPFDNVINYKGKL